MDLCSALHNLTCFFFFSSRRRHTRLVSDWSSDVCSSDLGSGTMVVTKTLETTIVPLPDPAMQAYHIAVDSKHHVWGNLWTADRIVRLDPEIGRASCRERV